MPPLLPIAYKATPLNTVITILLLYPIWIGRSILAHVRGIPIAVDLVHYPGFLQRPAHLASHKSAQEAHFLSFETIEVKVQPLSNPQVPEIVVQRFFAHADRLSCRDQGNVFGPLPILLCDLPPSLNLRPDLLDGPFS